MIRFEYILYMIRFKYILYMIRFEIYNNNFIRTKKYGYISDLR